MSAEKKRELIDLVWRSPQPKRTTIADLGLSRSTFYRWQRRYRTQGEVRLVDRKPKPGAVRNRRRPAEQTAILETALQQPDLSPRELACQVTDHAGFTVSEATVYRVLKRHGLNRSVTSLAPGTSCTVDITFTPAVIGQRSANVTFTDNSADTSMTVGLAGAGVVSGPNATLGAPYPVDFMQKAMPRILQLRMPLLFKSAAFA